MSSGIESTGLIVVKSGAAPVYLDELVVSCLSRWGIKEPCRRLAGRTIGRMLGEFFGA